MFSIVYDVMLFSFDILLIILEYVQTAVPNVEGQIDSKRILDLG